MSLDGLDIGAIFVGLWVKVVQKSIISRFENTFSNSIFEVFIAKGSLKLLGTG